MLDLKTENKKDKTISISKANLFGFLLTLPVLLIYFIPFYFLNFDETIIPNFKQSVRQIGIEYGSFGLFLIIIAISIVGVVLHELIHGLCWGLFAKKGFKSITFGVVWKMLTPYCHCKETLQVNQYIFGAIMPGIILGLLPAVYAVIYGSFGILLFGIFFTIAAAGDILMVYLLRKERMDNLVQDHPSEVGCYIYQKQ